MTASRALARSPMGADTRKFANLELRGLRRDDRFSGYASVFGEVDLGKDAIERGAFRKSLAERGAGGVRMLFQHDPAELIGAWKTIEDSRGLYVEGMLAVGVAQAREVHFDEFMETFEAFKDTNDRRLGEIEEKLTADVVTRDKMDRINRAMDEQKKVLDQLALKKPPLGRGGGNGVESNEHKAAFEQYIRRGDEAGLRGLEAKAMSAGTGTDGGYLVPPETDTDIGRRLSVVSPIRSLATVRQVSGSVLKKPFATSGMAAGWVAETAARPQTSSTQLATLSFPAMELYAMPAAT